jgi:hypothetical protein
MEMEAYMKLIRYTILAVGFFVLALAFGFIFQNPVALQLWPWPDGRLSYLFIGSILAAVGVAALWIGWTEEIGALPAGSLNVFVIAIGSAIYFFQLAGDRPTLIPVGWFSIAAAVLSGSTFLWSSRFPLHASLSTPYPVRVSFGIFAASLLFAGTALIFNLPIFPWTLNPDSAVIFGCIFIGDAFYFLHALFKPHWKNAVGQLLSFLAYDLVLIMPFLGLFITVEPALRLNLIVYVTVLIFSGALAVYYLFINSQTRIGLPVTQSMADEVKN